MFGCQYFTSPLNQLMIEEKLNSGLFKPGSLTPEKRVVLIHLANNKFCAEVPTEAGADVNRLQQIAVEADKKGDYKAGIEALLASSNANTVLNRRTQGVQLFLASSYFNCQMYMSYAINEGSLSSFKTT